MQTSFRRYPETPRLFEFPAELIVLYVLEAGQPVGDGPHVAAPLDVVLSPKRIEPGAVATDMARQEGQIEQRKNVVDRIVMFRNAKSPANLGTVSARVRMSHLPQYVRRNAGHGLRILEGVGFYSGLISFVTAGGVLNEGAVLQPGSDDLASDRVGQGNIRAHVDAQPNIGPARRAGLSRVDDIELGPIADALEDVMEEYWVRVTSVGSPDDNEVGILNLAIRAGSPAQTEYRRQTDDAWSVSGTVTAVDVVGSDNDPGKLLGEEVQFVCCFGTTEDSERLRTMLVDRSSKTECNPFEGFLPARRPKAALVANQGRCESRLMLFSHCHPPVKSILREAPEVRLSSVIPYYMPSEDVKKSWLSRPLVAVSGGSRLGGEA